MRLLVACGASGAISAAFTAPLAGAFFAFEVVLGAYTSASLVPVIASAVAGTPPAPTLHYLPNGGPYTVGPWRVAALGGTFAPSWYHSPVSALPPSRGRRASGASVKLGKSRDDKRRHFVRDEVLGCKALAQVDVFLTHEAPRPFYPEGKRIDTGKTVINEVLTAMRRYRAQMAVVMDQHGGTAGVSVNVATAVSVPSCAAAVTVNT